MNPIERDWRTPVVLSLLALVCLVPFNYMHSNVLLIGSRSVPIGRMIFFTVGAALLLVAVYGMYVNRKIGTFRFWLAALAVPLLVSSFDAALPVLAYSTTAGFVFRCVAIGWTAYEIGRNDAALQRFIPLAALLGAVVAFSGLYEVISGRWFLFERFIDEGQAATELWRPSYGIASGSIGQPLPLSAVLNLFFPLTYWQWQRTRRILWLVPVIVIAAGIVATFRRSACLILAFTVAAALWRERGQWLKSLAVVFVFLLGALAVPSVRTHLAERFNLARTAHEISDGHRGHVYGITVGILREKPLFGIGTRQYEKTSARYANYEGAVNTQDSQYLRTAAENGLFGVAVLLGFMIQLLLTLSRSPSPDGWPFLIACGAFALVLVVLDGFYWPAPAMVFFTIAGVGCGAAERHAADGREAR